MKKYKASRVLGWRNVFPMAFCKRQMRVVNGGLDCGRELMAGLKAGKVTSRKRSLLPWTNFFKTENILQLRELALKGGWLYGWKESGEWSGYQCGSPSWEISGMYQQQRKHHDASFVKLHVWQPATILRLLPFMGRLPEKVLTASVLANQRVFIEPLQIGDRTGRRSFRFNRRMCWEALLMQGRNR